MIRPFRACPPDSADKAGTMNQILTGVILPATSKRGR